MRSMSRFFAAFAFAACMIGMHSGAFALTTQNGTVCKPYGNSNTAGLYAYVSGVFNYSGGFMGVACPVVRTVAAPAGGYSVWVDGTAGSGTASCALYSYNYTGGYLGSTSVSVTGTFDRTLTLPQSQVPSYSHQVVYCYLPTNGGVYDVEPVQ